jgi:hypothetical protein
MLSSSGTTEPRLAWVVRQGEWYPLWSSFLATRGRTEGTTRKEKSHGQDYESQWIEKQSGAEDGDEEGFDEEDAFEEGLLQVVELGSGAAKALRINQPHSLVSKPTHLAARLMAESRTLEDAAAVPFSFWCRMNLLE